MIKRRVNFILGKQTFDKLEEIAKAWDVSLTAAITMLINKEHQLVKIGGKSK